MTQDLKVLDRPALLEQIVCFLAAQLDANEKETSEAPSEAFSLYSSRLSSALFWAALAHVNAGGANFPSQVCHERVRKNLSKLPNKPTEWKGRELAEMGIGGFTGLGATIYALSCIACLLEAPDLLEDALSFASLLDDARIRSDVDFDLVSGAAGALLAVLSLESACLAAGITTSLLRERAEACTQHLLDHSQLQGHDPSGWRSPSHTQSGHPQSGFAHGMAGIAHALLAQYRRTGEREILSVAQRARKRVRKMHLPGQQKWLPFEAFPPDQPMLTAWCWGGPGIALGVLANLDVDDGPAAREDLHTALNATCAQRQTAVDHLCCGNLGRVAVLDHASRHPAVEPSDSATYRQSADRILQRVLSRAKARGQLGWSSDTSSTDFDASFMKGASGAGYLLLSLAHPGSLPQPLLMEPPLFQAEGEPLVSTQGLEAHFKT